MIPGVKILYEHVDVMHDGFTKHINVGGFSVGGKTYVMMHLVVHARSKGLTTTTTTMVAHCAT